MAKRKPQLTPDGIRQLRLRLGLTIEAAAKKVGVKPSTWYKWELPSQGRVPSVSHFILIGLLEQGVL